MGFTLNGRCFDPRLGSEIQKRDFEWIGQIFIEAFVRMSGSNVISRYHYVSQPKTTTTYFKVFQELKVGLNDEKVCMKEYV